MLILEIFYTKSIVSIKCGDFTKFFRKHNLENFEFVLSSQNQVHFCVVDEFYECKAFTLQISQCEKKMKRILTLEIFYTKSIVSIKCGYVMQFLVKNSESIFLQFPHCVIIGCVIFYLGQRHKVKANEVRFDL